MRCAVPSHRSVRRLLPPETCHVATKVSARDRLLSLRGSIRKGSLSLPSERQAADDIIRANAVRGIALGEFSAILSELEPPFSRASRRPNNSRRLRKTLTSCHPASPLSLPPLHRPVWVFPKRHLRRRERLSRASVCLRRRAAGAACCGWRDESTARSTPVPSATSVQMACCAQAGARPQPAATRSLLAAARRPPRPTQRRRHAARTTFVCAQIVACLQLRPIAVTRV